MIYRSNLQCPDLRAFFKLKDPPLQRMGHDAPSDPVFDPGCEFWTHDECAILYNVAWQVGGDWLDLGARLGWTAAHIAAAGGAVTLVEPESKMDGFSHLLECNLKGHWGQVNYITYQMASEFLANVTDPYDGFVIDADHDRPQPTLDAIGCHRIAKPDAVILMHDFMGRPIQEAVCVLMALGWRCRIYDTPNGVALLWRGFGERCSLGSMRFHPPDHVPDPAINWAEIRERIARDEGFPYEKTE